MKPVFLFGNLKWWSYLNDSFAFIHLVRRLNSQNKNELSLLMISDTLICLCILVIPIGIIEISTSRKCWFRIYFSFLHDYPPPSTWNCLVHTSWSKMERCEKRAFRLLKMRKKIGWNIKTKCVTDFLLTVRSSSMKDYTFHYVVITKRQKFTLISIKIMRIWEFFLYK